MGLLETMDPKKHSARKLTKVQRLPSLQYPARLKAGDDVENDVAFAHGKAHQHMNQSVLSIIATAGSKSDFHSRFNEDSSGSDGDQNGKKTKLPSTELEDVAKPHAKLASQDVAIAIPNKKIRRHASTKLLRSLPKLNLRTAQERNYMSHSVMLPSREPRSEAPLKLTPTPRDAPVMSQMLEAQAKVDRIAVDSNQSKGLLDIAEDSEDDAGPSTLSTRLMEIFGFDQPEEVASEYPCWLLQSVLLQGYMYITEKHICFYAYLPKKSNVTAKSGYLAKRGKQSPRFNRYWFTLKGDVLSYYSDSSDLYFPNGNIDLRYGISATLLEHKDRSKESTHFLITTQSRMYTFKADSHASAREWVKTLQKVIFRSHNDGDSVKISIPILNIIDIEESPVVDFAETFKIRAIDNDETFAIDEASSTIASFGKDAFDVLRSLVDKTADKRVSRDFLSALVPRSPGSPARSQGAPRSPGSPKFPDSPGSPSRHDSVRATLAHGPSIKSGKRLSGDWNLNRSSVELPRQATEKIQPDHHLIFEPPIRRTASARRAKEPGIVQTSTGLTQDSSESYVQSLDPGTDSSIPMTSSGDVDGSASQILDGSDVFRSPTIIHHNQQSPYSRSRDSTESFHKDLRSGQILEQPSSKTQKSDSVKPKERPATSKQVRSDSPNRSPHKSTTSLHQIVLGAAYPLQRAAGLAGYLRNSSKRMSSLLATESMGYVEKVSGMWAGGRQHYDDTEGLAPEDGVDEVEDGEGDEYGNRFRAHFALPETERLQATYFGFLHRVLPLYGKIYISNRKFCFRSLLPGTRTKLVLPLKDIENVDKEKGFRLRYSGLVIVIRAFEELFFEFSSSEVRDDCCVTLLQGLESIRYLQESGLLTQEDNVQAEKAKAEHRMLQEARTADGQADHDILLPHSADTVDSHGEVPPILFDDPRASILNFKPTESLRITCLTIGSRGDVQPYIALCKGLLAEGHRPKIATHREFEPWVRKHGIDFAPVEGDPAELMRICVENGMFTVSFLKEASTKMRGWIDELLASAWKSCQDTDLLVESPSAMAGIHIAEALGVPYFRAFTMPWTRTRAYPHAFAVPEHKMGGAYNYVTYVMFDNLFWTAIAGQVNRWRKKELGLRSTNLDKLHPNKVPFLYNFSPSVVVPPIDYSDWIRVTGYWFLDEASDWTPPKELTDFIKQARQDGKKLVYIGFGSIVVSDPEAVTRTVVESVLKADVRCILSKGWSDRLGHKNATVVEIPLPSEILQIKSAPHDWLFQQIDAAAHHGGAGTTGASLRAGLPTIVKPFFGDQFFFGSRIEDLGVGICMKKLNVSTFSRALWEATHSERMILKAKVLGEQIRKENGVATAIQAIYRDLEYAKTLIKRRTTNPDYEGVDEESWTFIGDESDPWDRTARKLLAETQPVEQHLAEAAEERSKERGRSKSKGGFLGKRASMEVTQSSGQGAK